jgi:signal transduction histidine kinase
MTYERFLEALHPADRERVDRAVQTALDRHEEYEMETRTVWPDGTVHWVATRGRAYFDTSGRAVRMSGVAMDITDRKQVEQSLIRSEKLASVGRMAATIAHEISNPLSSTINALFLVRTDPALPEEAKRYLSLAEQELNRVSHITKQTLGFYKEVGNPVALNAPEALDSILDLYAPRLKNKNISLQRSYGCSSRIFVIDGEFRQIVSGVIANSIDALPEGGTLHVRLSGPSALNAESRSMLRLTIADNGEGIAEENLKRIFEPFFTTKQSIGTGLGLWVTSELVKKNGGKLRLRSRLGKGTVVTLWLPVERRELERNAA